MIFTMSPVVSATNFAPYLFILFFSTKSTVTLTSSVRIYSRMEHS